MSDNSKRNRTQFNGFHHPVVDFWRREVGGISSRKFSDRFSASENLVQRLEIHRKLVKLKDYVNTVSFNTQGDVLISGSRDRRVILWDWQLGKVKLSFHSRHSNNVLQAKFMPFSDDRTIVTCAADGRVRRANILESGKVETVLLGSHKGWAHKLCTEPGNPHIFYTSGDDGFVQRFDLRTQAPTKLFKCQWHDVGSLMRVARLKAMAIDPRNSNLLAVGGMDEYARLYDIRRSQGDGFSRPADQFCPPHLIDNFTVRITGLAFSEQSELLVSYLDEFIYLFTHDMGLGSNPTPVSKSNDDSKHSGPMVFKGQKHCSEEGVNFFGPRSDYVVSGTDCGRIFIWKKKSGELIRVMEADNRDVVNCIEPHPHIPMLASTNKFSCDIKLWTSAERATLPDNIDMSLGCNGMDGGIDGSEEEDESIDGNEEDDESIDDGSEEEDESIDGSEEEDESIDDGSEEEDESIDGNEEDDDSDVEKLSPRLMRLRRNNVNDVFVDRMDLGIDGNEVEVESIDDAEDDDSDDSSGLDENDSDDEMDTDDSDDDECSIEIDNTRDTNGDGGSERNAADSVTKSCEDDDDDDDDD